LFIVFILLHYPSNQNVNLWATQFFSVAGKKLELTASIVRDATPTLGQFQRRLKTLLFHLAYERDLTAHQWLSTLLERRTMNVRT